MASLLSLKAVQVMGDSKGLTGGVGRGPAYLLTYPLRLALSSPVWDVGREAWDRMTRSAFRLAARVQIARLPRAPPPDRKGKGSEYQRQSRWREQSYTILCDDDVDLG